MINIIIIVIIFPNNMNWKVALNLLTTNNNSFSFKDRPVSGQTCSRVRTRPENGSPAARAPDSKYQRPDEVGRVLNVLLKVVFKSFIDASMILRQSTKSALL